jgi:hypothetical protein
VAVALAGVAAVGGCQGANTRDLKGVSAKNPSKTELYANVDNHPNIVRLCIDGLAFVTTSREMDPLLRVPEWDAWCKS